AASLEDSQVDAMPQLAIDHLAIGGEAGSPRRRVVPVKVIDGPGGWQGALDSDIRIGVQELQREVDSLRRVWLLVTRLDQEALMQSPGWRGPERQHDLARSEQEGIPRSHGEVAHTRIGLSLVLHEGQRKLGISRRVGRRPRGMHQNKKRPENRQGDESD